MNRAPEAMESFPRQAITVPRGVITEKFPVARGPGFRFILGPRIRRGRGPLVAERKNKLLIYLKPRPSSPAGGGARSRLAYPANEFLFDPEIKEVANGRPPPPPPPPGEQFTGMKIRGAWKPVKNAPAGFEKQEEKKERRGRGRGRGMELPGCAHQELRLSAGSHGFQQFFIVTVAPTPSPSRSHFATVTGTN